MKHLLVSRTRVFLLCLDISIVAACYYFAFVVRLEKLWPHELPTAVLPSLPVAVVGVIAGMIITGVYRSMIRYTSVKDLLAIIKGAAIGDGVLLIFITAAYGVPGYPRSVFLLFPLFVVGAYSFTRIGFRLLVEAATPVRGSRRSAR
jgi:FlaA1/EpsC-like NDP-sugar epimerase